MRDKREMGRVDSNREATTAALLLLTCSLATTFALGGEPTGDDEAHMRELESRAVQSIERARQLGNLWSGTAAKVKRARAIAETGHYAEAFELLYEADEEARFAAEQAQLEHARYVFQRLAASRVQVPVGELDALWRMILDRNAARASRLADELVQRYGP